MSPAVPFLALAEALKVHFLAAMVGSAAGLPAPPAGAAVILFLAWATGRILGSAGGLVFLHVFVKAVVFGGSFLSLSLLAGYPPIRDLSGALEGGGDWVRLAAALAVAGVFWLRGSWLERRKPDHAFCVARFDGGAGLFLVVLAIAALTGEKDPRPAAGALPFLAFSILALGLARAEEDVPGAFRRYSVPAGLLSFSALFLGTAAGLALLVPLLTEPASRVGEALAQGAPALLHFLGRLLGRVYRLDTAAPRPAEAGAYALPRETGDPEGGTLTDIFAAVLGGLAALLAAALVAAALVRLIRRLASPSERRRRPLDLSFPARWLSALAAVLRRVMMLLRSLRSPRGSSPALKAYGRLLAAGRFLGMARNRNETPREYVRRLAAAFPRSAAEAEFVVDCLEREVYGGKPRDPERERQLAGIRRGTRLTVFLGEKLRHRSPPVNPPSET